MCKLGTALIVTVLATGCASTGAVPRPFPTPGGSPAPRPAPAPPRPIGTSGTAGTTEVGDGYAIAGTALTHRGSPYRSGGTDPSGFDCSGLIWYAYAQHGIRLPRTVREQFREGANIGVDALEAGDLIFFRTNGADVSHVGLAIGGDEFVHAPGSGRDVRVERLSSSYWAARLAGVKRIR